MSILTGSHVSPLFSLIAKEQVKTSPSSSLASHVMPNYTFEDHDTGGARELDFHATGAESISIERSEFAFIIILGSCKANAHSHHGEHDNNL
jgi:hypothetical protein